VSLPYLRCEIAFASDPGGGSPAYQDVSTRIMACTIRRGRQYELDTIQPSTLSLRLDNGDRALDPTYPSSPYYPNVLPMRPIRISADWAGVTYYLFAGYVERWPITTREAPAWGSATLTGIDAMATLSACLITGSFAQELTGARISEVLSAAGWAQSAPVAASYWILDAGKLDTTTRLSYAPPTTLIDPGRSQVQAVTIDATSQTDALQHIQAMAAAERGIFFIDGQGRACFHDRAHRFNTQTQGRFVDVASTPSGIYYQDLTPDFDAARIYNDVTVTASPGGTPQNAYDAQSQLHYLRRSLVLTPPLVSDSDAASLASYELALHKDAQFRFSQLTLKPQGQDAAWPHALGRELSDQILVSRNAATPRTYASGQYDAPCFVESIQHDIRPGEWLTTFQLSPANLYTGWLTLGTAQLDYPATTGASAALGF
jgi:hypothetical protein